MTPAEAEELTYGSGRYLGHVQSLLKDTTEVAEAAPTMLHLRCLRISGLPHSCRPSHLSVHVATRPSGSACVQPVAEFTSREGVGTFTLCLQLTGSLPLVCRQQAAAWSGWMGLSSGMQCLCMLTCTEAGHAYPH